MHSPIHFAFLLILPSCFALFRKAILLAFLLLCSHGRKNDIAMLRKFLRKVLGISLRLRKFLRKVLGITTCCARARQTLCCSAVRFRMCMREEIPFLELLLA